MSFRFLRYGVAIIAVLGLSIWVMRFLSDPSRQKIVTNYWQQITTTSPETFTELYFDHSDKLPPSTAVASKQTYNFVIRSLESKPTIYSYTIDQITNDEHTTLGSGQIEVLPTQQKLVPIILPQLENIRTQIVVELTGVTTQQISFWLEAI